MFGPTHNQFFLPGLGVHDEPLFVPEPVAGSDGRLSHYLLFFAFLPPTATAQHIFHRAEELRRRHGLRKLAMPSDRLHVTVQPVVEFAEGIPRLIVQAAVRAASSIAAGCRPVAITFGSVGSMGPASPSTLALQCDAASRHAVSELRAGLVAALRRNGFALAPHRVPHMSLVYGTDHVAEHPIEPIHWTANCLVLILSHHGLGHHELVAQWPLWMRER